MWYSIGFHQDNATIFFLTPDRETNEKYKSYSFQSAFDILTSHIDDPKIEERVFSIMLQLSNYRSTVLEMLQADTLYLLFNLITIQCPPYNSHYRERFVWSSIIFVEGNLNNILLP